MRLAIRFLAAVPVIAALATTLFVVRAAHADELKLKDGTKISGTIVGFDDNSFKVKTNYGFAVVQKDQVVSISITPAAKIEDAEKKVEPASKSDDAGKTPAPAKPAKPEAAVAVAAANSVVPLPAPAAATPVAPPASAPKPSGAKAVATPAASSVPVAAATSPVPSAPAVTAASIPPAPPKPAAPEVIRENVDGNTYTNETYGFQMYKPPDWQVIAGARTLLPGTITAMGTGDQTTYLLIGQAPAGKTLSIDEDAADRRLRDIMENFRPLGNEHVTISGIAAVEHKFRGSVDQHDWSGVVVLVPRGAQLYTIFGMTLADTDLVQIQENVISRAISSLQFTKQ
jgi:hypothetical protein